MPSKKRTSQPKTSKAVIDRQKTCLRLLAELEATDLEPPGVVGPTTLLQGLAPWLRHSIGTLVALDEKVFATGARLAVAREQRDAALRRLAHDVAKLRLSIEGQYKAPQVGRLGFESPTPRSPEPLLRVAGRVAKNLAQPEVGELLGQPWFHRPFDPTTQKANLASQVEALRHLLRQVDHLQRDLDLARIHRRRAQDEHDTLAREARQMVTSVRRLSQLAHDQHQPTPHQSAARQTAAAPEESPRPPVTASAAPSESTPTVVPTPRKEPDHHDRQRTNEPVTPHRAGLSPRAPQRDPVPRPGAGAAPPSGQGPNPLREPRRGCMTKPGASQAPPPVWGLTSPSAPKGHDPSAQGKRSAALGRLAPGPQAPEGGRQTPRLGRVPTPIHSPIRTFFNIDSNLFGTMGSNLLWAHRTPPPAAPSRWPLGGGSGGPGAL